MPLLGVQNRQKKKQTKHTTLEQKSASVKILMEIAVAMVAFVLNGKQAKKNHHFYPNSFRMSFFLFFFLDETLRYG